MHNCPSCNRPGRKVKRVTLESLLSSDRRADIGGEPFHVCLTPECETVYFGAGDTATFVKSDLSVRFGLKETAPPRPLCYCFEHSIEGIHDEIRRTGRSTVLDRIKAAMKGPGCRCEYTNPLGTCCLGTVRQTIEEAKRASSPPVAGETSSTATCCSLEASGEGAGGVPGSPSSSRAGMLALLGSATAAALSSACCWVPLVLLGFGVSAGGVAAAFEAWRPTFLVVAGVLLALGFFATYRRTGARDGGCAPTSRMTRVNRAMLWGSTAFVAALALFPSYVGALMGRSTDASTEMLSESSNVEVVVAIEGMTCEGCEAVLHAALTEVSDVIAAEVSYESKRATVTVAKLDKEVRRRLVEAVRRAGYRIEKLNVPAADGK